MRAYGVWSLSLAAVVLFGCVAGPPFDESPMNMAGRLNGTTIWSGEVVMGGDVLIPAGSTLVIRPGTLIRVPFSQSTKIDPEYLSAATELLIRGTLLSQGTLAEPVRFEVVGMPPDETVGWAGIILDGAQDSVIEGTVVEQAEAGVLCLGSSPVLRHNRIRRCRYGVIAQAGSAPQILQNSMEQGEGGVFCWQGSNPYLLDNRIFDNQEEGVFVDRTSRPRLEGNRISGNAIGLALFPRDLSYDSNLVRDNGENLRWLGPEGAGQ